MGFCTDGYFYEALCLFLKALKGLEIFSFYWKFKCKVDLNIQNCLAQVPHFFDKQELRKLMLFQKGVVHPYCP